MTTLNLWERLTLLNLLPEKGNITQIRQARELREMLGLTDEEHESWNIRQEGQQVYWGPTGLKGDAAAAFVVSTEKEFDFGRSQQNMIVETLQGLEEKGELTESLLGLWDKFDCDE